MRYYAATNAVSAGLSIGLIVLGLFVGSRAIVLVGVGASAIAIAGSVWSYNRIKR